MSTDDPEMCDRCGAPLPAPTEEALCPACLLSGVMAPTGTEETIPGEASPGTPSVRRWSATRSEPRAPRFPCEFGGYRLLSLLGRGGMGTVYEAEQLATGRRVALKVLEHEIDSPEMRQRFLREGRLAAAISHPNSVYIFGTEEIDGQAVIVMEVAEGGTLKDKVKRRGPLPVAEAVDSILDVITGLEAAGKGGVLHRDVKPSNCFVNPDGSVKVGDFGLSVSTLATTDTFLTASGVMLGTPSYAPPEQLRGDEMDGRADIYSVGATLYTLLTGRAPFEGDNAVKVVASVLSDRPKPVRELRKEIPAGLSQIVGRCLAKNPENRFPGYLALRDALMPYSSATPQPAPLGIRFCAGFIDETISMLPGLLMMALLGVEAQYHWLSERTLSSGVPWIAWSVFYVAYHAVPEGLWGAAVGKAVFGIRVARSTGQSPGLGRASVRALIALVALDIGTYLTFFMLNAAEYREAVTNFDVRFTDWLFVITWWSLFLTMRRRNGYANVMDLASGTRVVLKPKLSPRPVLGVPAPDAKPAAPEGVPAGPFQVVKTLVPGEFLEASDPVLRRRVWLRRRETVELAAERRDLARPGRLRWLQEVEYEGEGWDAYEAPAGLPLTQVAEANGRPHWESVRYWLCDLADELDAGSRDGTLPEELGLDRVWITATGRAVLLDEPWMKWGNSRAEGIPAGESETPQRFLSTVAECAAPASVPLYARSFLCNLKEAAFEKFSFAAGGLKAQLTKAPRVSRARRAASLLTMPLLLLPFLTAGVVFNLQMFGNMAAEWEAKYPELPALSHVLRFRQMSSKEDQALVDLHLAGHYASLPEVFPQPKMSSEGRSFPRLWDREREIVRKAVEKHGVVKPERLAETDRKLRVRIDEFLQRERLFLLMGAVFMTIAVLTLIAAVQLITVLVFRNTLGQVLFRFAVVNRDGERAGRLRLLGRWLLVWWPFLLMTWFLRLYEEHPPTGKVFLVLTFLCLAAWLAGVVYAVCRPSRGVQDLGARTWLVPR